MLTNLSERLFHISATLESEKNNGTKNKPKIVQSKQRCIHSKQFEVLAPSFSRRDLVRVAYEAIGVEDHYVIGMEAGPPVTAHWVGTWYFLSFLIPLVLMNILRGGPNTAVSITNDKQWTGFKNSLQDTPKTVVEIWVILKSNELSQWKRSAIMTVNFLTHI